MTSAAGAAGTCVAQLTSRSVPFSTPSTNPHTLSLCGMNGLALDPGDRLAYVAVEVAERFEGERWADAGLVLDLALHVGRSRASGPRPKGSMRTARPPSRDGRRRHSLPRCYLPQTAVLRAEGRSEGVGSKEVSMPVNRADPIERNLDGEMRVHRITGPIVGAIAVAIALLAIVLYFQSL